jgi:hypothetical protein
MLCIWSTDGNNVVHLRHPSVVKGPAAKFNFFSPQQLSMSCIRETWFCNRAQIKEFKVLFVLCLYTTHSFIIVNNAKLVHRRRSSPYIYIYIYTLYIILLQL